MLEEPYSVLGKGFTSWVVLVAKRVSVAIDAEFWVNLTEKRVSLIEIRARSAEPRARSAEI